MPSPKDKDPLSVSLQPIQADLLKATTPSTRAAVLVKRAQIYARHGKQDLAFRDLKQALSLAPQDASIADALRGMQSMSLGGTMEEPGVLIKQMVDGDKEARRKWENLLGSREFARKIVEEGLVSRILQEDSDIDREMAGLILVRLSAMDESIVVAELIKMVQNTETRVLFLDYGPNGVEALTNTLLKKWNDEDKRLKNIQQAIPQLTDRLSKSPDEALQIALLNSLIRLFTSNPQLLENQSDLPFDSLFPLLSSLQPQPIRSRTIVLLSTLLSKQDSQSPLLSTLQSRLSDFITTHFSSSTPSDYITAISVLTAIFTIKTDLGTQIFLQEGFLEEALEDPLEIDDNNDVVKTLLELLSAAAVDKTCRTRILEIAEPFLKDCAKGESTGIRALAGSVLAKLSSASIQTMNVQVDLLTIFKDAYQAKNETALLSAIEGLAFTSVSATEKDKLIKDPLFINSLLTLLKSPNQQYPLVYGCLSILVNLTTYKPVLNEEQKRINEIRRLAKETDIHSVEELDKDTYVTSRCKLLLAAGLIPTMNVLANHSSPACISAISRILLSSATAPGHRSVLAHQGAIKLILSQLSKSVDSDTEIILSHALAKILISVNPSLVFSSRTPITTPLQPLTSLLSNESLPNDLPRFEALLALTNLASAEDVARTRIVEKSWPLIETLLLNDNALLQRASTELLCNLVVCQRGVEKFIPGEKNPSAVSRLHLLLALADVEDVHTRRAAGGALAMVTDFEEVCMGLLEVERGVERVGRMVEDQDEECGFRGVVCVRNLVGNGGTEARRQMRRSGIVGKVEGLMKSKNERIRGLCKEVIGMLA